MGFVSVKELFPGRQGSDTIQRNFRHTRVFEVITDDPTIDDFVAGAAPGVPRNGDLHPSNPFAVMVDISATQSDQSYYIWTVVCEYSSDLVEAQAREGLQYDDNGDAVAPTPNMAGGPGDRQDNPLDRPLVWSTDTEEREVPVLEWLEGGEPPFDPWPAAFGRKVVNSAGDPFDPPLTQTEFIGLVTVEKNYPIPHDILNLRYQVDLHNKCNDDNWRGFNPGTMMVRKVRASSQFENNVFFARVSFTFAYNSGGWQPKIEDAGYNKRVGVGSTPDPYRRVPIMVRDEDTGETAGKDKPHLLDGLGQPLAADAEPVVLQFWTRDRIDFEAVFGF